MNMKKTTLAIALLSGLFSGAVYAGDNGGGFSGPSGTTQGGYVSSGTAGNVVTAQQAAALPDEARVVLQGRITQHLHGGRYMFEDASGTIVLDVDDDAWMGQNITPEMNIEIQGEIDTHRLKPVEVDVDVIRILK